MPTQAERTQATRSALLDAGRELFGERGYADVSVDELVERAGVTSGALYHHFGSKEALFRGVYGELVNGVARRIIAARAGRSHSDLWGDCEVYLDACVDPIFHRITLRDAPAVLGWETIRDGASALVEAGLAEARARGELADQAVEPLARVLVAALKEAGAIIAGAEDPARARAEVGATIRRLFDAVTSA